jgi:fumarate reductase subunit D
MARRTIEPLLWLLFSAGGVLSALVMPILLLLLALAFPFSQVRQAEEDRLHLEALLSNPLIALVLFLLCSLALFHWAHRFRYTLYDGLQIKHLNELVNLICYGGAIVGSVVAGYLLLFPWR